MSRRIPVWRGRSRCCRRFRDRFFGLDGGMAGPVGECQRPYGRRIEWFQPTSTRPRMGLFPHLLPVEPATRRMASGRFLPAVTHPALACDPLACSGDSLYLHVLFVLLPETSHDVVAQVGGVAERQRQGFHDDDGRDDDDCHGRLLYVDAYGADMRLHSYQASAVRFALDSFHTHGGCGLFLDMGLGKTLTTICIMDLWHAMHPDARFLVVAPKTVAVNTWPAELEKWSDAHRLDFAVACGMKSDPKRRLAALDQGATVTIINQENLGWLDEHVAEWPWDCIVLDELSGYKDSGSKRFRLLKRRRRNLNAGPSRSRRGCGVSWILGLTGTPAAKGLMDLWAQCFLLDGGRALGSTLTAYRSKWFTPGRRNGHVVYEWKPRGDAYEGIMAAIAPFCLTMLARDKLPGLPKATVIDHMVPMPEDTRVAYDGFRRDMWMETGGVEVSAVNAGVLCNKLAQFTAGCVYSDVDGRVVRLDDAKLDELDRIIAESQGEQVLVFYQFRDELERLRARYGRLVHTTDEPDVVARWDRREVPILAAHPASSRFGLNLQRSGHIVVWLSLTWSLEAYAQSNCRLDRQGQTRPVQIHRLLEPDTVDVRKVMVLEGRAGLAGAVMDELRHGL